MTVHRDSLRGRNEEVERTTERRIGGKRAKPKTERSLMENRGIKITTGVSA